MVSPAWIRRGGARPGDDRAALPGGAGALLAVPARRRPLAERLVLPGARGEREQARDISASAVDGGLAVDAAGHARGGPRRAEAPLGGHERGRRRGRLLEVRRRGGGRAARRGRGRGHRAVRLLAQYRAAMRCVPGRRRGRPRAPGGCRRPRRRAAVLLMGGGRFVGRVPRQGQPAVMACASRVLRQGRLAFGLGAKSVPAVLRKLAVPKVR